MQTYAHVCRFYIANGHVLLTLIIVILISVCIGVTISTGLPLLDSKWQAYNEEQS